MLAALVDDATTLLTIAVLGFMGVRLVGGLRVARSGRGRLVVLAVRSRIGWRHVWPVPVVLALVVVAAGVLMAVPGLDWGWWSALGGVGNPVFGSTDSTAGTPLEWVVPLVFLGLLVPALPLFANAEERMFREGAEQWTTWHRVRRTMQFGLVHALIGIPIGAAIALSLGGAYFMVVYLRSYRRTGSAQEATLESTTAHTVYNGVIIVVVIIALVLTALGV
ncbi:MAG: hypothetical protein WEB78_01780 [Ilumatobacteraceae bacterium]